jgi:putative ABC transport system substrate-binding protein
MRRRDLLTLVGGVTLFPFPVRAQSPSKPALIGSLGVATPPYAVRYQKYLRDGLRELGEVEGQTFTITGRYAEFRPERLPALAEELVRLDPAVIVGVGVDVVVAARKVTSVIPIVSAALADAEHLGLVKSYAHPGGNVTGITPYVEGLPAKQIELARELVPGAVKIGLLGNLNDPKAPPQRDESQGAAKKLGVGVIVPEVSGPEDLPAAIAALANNHVDVVIVLQTTTMLNLRREIGSLLNANHLPAVYGYREHIEEGGLISYGVDLAWSWRRLWAYVHKIMHGAKPADLPIEFPSRLQLVINLRTAKALGIEVQRSLLARADEVIE